MNIIPKEKRVAIEQLLRLGVSYRNIAKLVGSNKMTVQHIAHAIGEKRTTGFRGMGITVRRNQVISWTEKRKVPLRSTTGVTTASDLMHARAALMDVRRWLKYGLPGQSARQAREP